MSEAGEPRVVTVGHGRRDYVPGVSLEWLADANLTPGSGMTFGRAQFEPGSSNPVHYHPNCHELVFVAEGEIEHTLGSQTVTLSRRVAVCTCRRVCGTRHATSAKTQRHCWWCFPAKGGRRSSWTILRGRAVERSPTKGAPYIGRGRLRLS